MNPLSKRVGSVEFGLTLAARGAAAPLAFVANMLLARLLGPGAYGEYMTLLSAALVAGGVGAFGAGPLLTREIAATPLVVRARVVGRIARWAMRFTAQTSLLAICLLIAWFYVGLGAPTVGWRQHAATLGIVIAAVAIALIAGLLAGMGQVFKSQSIVNFWKNALLLIGIGALAAAGLLHSVLDALAVQLGAYLASIGLGGWWLYQEYSAIPKAGCRTSGVTSAVFPKMKPRQLRASATHFFVGSAAILLLARLDVLIVNAIAGAQTAGIFAVAARLGQMGGIAGLTWIAWLQPRLALRAQQEDSAEVDRLLRVGCLGSLLMTLVLLGAGWLVAPWLMSVLGHGFKEAIAPFRWILVGCVVWSPSVPFYVLLTMSGRERVVARILWLQVIVTAGLSLPLVKHFGALGGAWAWFAGMCLASVLTIAGAVSNQRRSRKPAV